MAAMDVNEVLREADDVGLGRALSALDDALSALERGGDHELGDWAELTCAKAFWLVQMQRSADAVRCASRLVDAVNSADPGVDADLASRAMARLVGAYESDDDSETAELIARAMLERFPSTRDPAGWVAHVRARTCLARCRRRLGRVESARADLWALLNAQDHVTEPGIWTEVTVARGELALCLLAAGSFEAAVETGASLPADVLELGSAVSRAPLIDVCERLAVATRRAGRLAESVRFSEAALGLLERDRQAGGTAEACQITTMMVEMLTELERLSEATRLGEQCLRRHRASDDPETVYAAAMAGLASAEAWLRQRDPAEAMSLLQAMPDVGDRSVPGAETFAARLGLVRAACAMQVGGAGAAMRAYEEMLLTLADARDLRARSCLADAMTRDCCLRLSFGNGDKAIGRAQELIALWRSFPAGPDLIPIAETCNRMTGALFGNDQVTAATDLARAVIERQEELLDGPRPEVCVTAYTLLSDALMFTRDPATLSEVWDGILSLGEPALLVLEGLAAHYRDRDDLRVVLLYTYIGRSAVLTELGRESDAETLAADLLAEFASDEDEQVRQILGEFRSRRPGDED
jgi:hypothetical protein